MLYIFSVSAAILILDRTPHGLEEFKTILNGNIIWVTPREVFSTFLPYAAVGLVHFFLRKQFLALTFEGRGTIILEFLFFATFAVVLVKSVKLAGILQVFSFLVIPALIGRLFSLTPFKVLMIGWIVGVFVTIAGMALSYKLDVPTAPVIVAGLALVFFTLLVFTEVPEGGPAPKGFVDLVINASIKTPLGKPGYSFLVNIDGQAGLWKVDGQKEMIPLYDEKGRTSHDSDAGEGTKYLPEKKVRLAAGPHTFFGLPEETYYIKIELTLKEDGSVRFGI